MKTHEVQLAAPGWTTWHLTWGTYGARRHGGGRPTVAREHNKVGEPFVEADPEREALMRKRMRGGPVYLSCAERCVVEREIPALCERGGWALRECAAGPDHVHVLCDLRAAVHGEQVRRWLKTWMSKALNEACAECPPAKWCAKAGSTRVVKGLPYLRNVTDYVHRQRATRGDG